MQIVIDISKEMYENALNDRLCGSETLVNAIKNGIPLSKIVDSLKELSKDYRHNYIGNSHEERAWRLGIEDSIDLILAESEGL